MLALVLASLRAENLLLYVDRAIEFLPADRGAVSSQPLIDALENDTPGTPAVLLAAEDPAERGDTAARVEQGDRLGRHLGQAGLARPGRRDPGWWHQSPGSPPRPGRGDGRGPGRVGGGDDGGSIPGDAGLLAVRLVPMPTDLRIGEGEPVLQVAFVAVDQVYL